MFSIFPTIQDEYKPVVLSKWWEKKWVNHFDLSANNMRQFNEEIQKSKLIYTSPITLAWTNEKLETVIPRRWGSETLPGP